MFYEFRQNNSGGVFEFDADRGITHVVIVEADSIDDANTRAEVIGLYFDGCDDGTDCSCCGDRWYALYSNEEGSEVPAHYGTPLIDVHETGWMACGWMGDNPEVFVHLKDGRFFGFHKVDGRYVYKGDTADLQVRGELLMRGMKEIES